MQGERHKGRNVRVPQPGECGAGHISAIGGWDDIPAQVWCISVNSCGGGLVAAVAELQQHQQQQLLLRGFVVGVVGL